MLTWIAAHLEHLALALVEQPGRHQWPVGARTVDRDRPLAQQHHQHVVAERRLSGRKEREERGREGRNGEKRKRGERERSVYNYVAQCMYNNMLCNDDMLKHRCPPQRISERWRSGGRGSRVGCVPDNCGMSACPKSQGSSELSGYLCLCVHAVQYQHSCIYIYMH